ncbi:hypothetical protein BDV93DRAFT_249972 [Ceratobasidium sp. AG-I]|nr:hypothetical protein BDV93DRAFT_249972 [Ceratobasidium sp. AG-I]
MHIPYVAPVPFLSAYALYAQVAHPGEPTPPPPPPLPQNLFVCPSAIGVPNPESVPATPELAQFISPLLLDAMFVVGALFHGYPEMSNQFYKRAEARVIAEAANPRLATVQGVMLMAMTELGHARAPAAWTLNGMFRSFSGKPLMEAASALQVLLSLSVCSLGCISMPHRLCVAVQCPRRCLKLATSYSGRHTVLIGSTRLV